MPKVRQKVRKQTAGSEPCSVRVRRPAHHPMPPLSQKVQEKGRAANASEEHPRHPLLNLPYPSLVVTF